MSFLSESVKPSTHKYRFQFITSRFLFPNFWILSTSSWLFPEAKKETFYLARNVVRAVDIYDVNFSTVILKGLKFGVKKNLWTIVSFSETLWILDLEGSYIFKFPLQKKL